MLPVFSRTTRQARFSLQLFVLCFASLSFCQSTATQVADLQRQARAAAALGNMDKALASCDEALKLNPRSTQSSLLKSSLLLQAGRFPEAITAYQAVRRAHPADETAVVGLSTAYRKVFNYEEADKVLSGYLARRPRAVSVRIALAELDLQQQHYEQAVRELKRVLTQDANNAQAHLDLGVAYQSLNQGGLALAEFNAAIRHNPQLISAYYFRGRYLSDQNDNAHAAEDAQKVLQKEPENRPAAVLLAKIELRLSKCEEAQEILKPVVQAEKENTEALFLLSRAYECTHQEDFAKITRSEFDRVSHEQESMHSAQTDADHLAEQAAEAARHNQLQPAMDFLQQALAKDPQNASAHALLAKIYFSEGDAGKAQKAIEVALQAKPYHPDYLYVLGKIREKQGDRGGALSAFQQVIAVNPAESDAYFEIAEIYHQTGQRSEAIAALRKAVQLSPGDADYKHALALLEAEAPPTKR